MGEASNFPGKSQKVPGKRTKPPAKCKKTSRRFRGLGYTKDNLQLHLVKMAVFH